MDKCIWSFGNIQRHAAFTGSSCGHFVLCSLLLSLFDSILVRHMETCRTTQPSPDHLVVILCRIKPHWISITMSAEANNKCTKQTKNTKVKYVSLEIKPCWISSLSHNVRPRSVVKRGTCETNQVSFAQSISCRDPSCLWQNVHF